MDISSKNNSAEKNASEKEKEAARDFLDAMHGSVIYDSKGNLEETLQKYKDREETKSWLLGEKQAVPASSKTNPIKISCFTKKQNLGVNKGKNGRRKA